MTLRLMIAAAILATLASHPTRACADTKRIAVVVGNNRGGGEQTPLRYAEADASKFASVMTELGGVGPDDLYLLQGQDVTALTEALARVKHRIAQLRADPATRVILLFYFSGHSDGEALELGRTRLTFADLRKWLATAGSNVRVAIVDSCKSGALLAVKGGTPGAAFQIRLADDLATSGEALLTSSAANEVALESSEIGGSFFTHHFISALRGAADVEGTGVVTLNDAYRYAYAHTIATTGETVIGPQHPGYDYRLSGQGEVVLAEIAKPMASLEVPHGFDRVLVVELAHDQVVAELGADAHNVIALQSGYYAVRAWRGGKLFATKVALAAGDRRVVGDAELVATAAPPTTSKYDGGVPRWSFALAAGGEASFTDNLGLIPGVRAELSNGPWTASLTAGTRESDGLRETSSFLLAGYRVRVVRDRLTGWLGIDAGPGLIVQSVVHPLGYSAALETSAVAGASLRVTGRTSVMIEATLPAAMLQRDGALAVEVVPAAWLGVVIRF
jgi:hypothetical protein